MKVVITVIRAWPSGAHCLREDLEEMASLEVLHRVQVPNVVSTRIGSRKGGLHFPEARPQGGTLSQRKPGLTVLGSPPVLGGQAAKTPFL